MLGEQLTLRSFPRTRPTENEHLRQGTGKTVRTITYRFCVRNALRQFPSDLFSFQRLSLCNLPVFETDTSPHTSRQKLCGEAHN